MYLLFVLVLFESGFRETVAMPFPGREQCEQAQQDFVTKLSGMKFTALDSVNSYATVCVPLRALEAKT